MARELRLLIVEDDPDLRCLLGEILRQLGTVVAAPDVYQALNAVRYQSFDAIVLDLVFPGASGFDLMERLRTLQTLTPVVVVGLASDTALRRARALGAHAFITNPSDVDLLLRTVADAADASSHSVPLFEWEERSAASTSVKVPGPSDSGPTRTLSGSSGPVYPLSASRI